MSLRLDGPRAVNNKTSTNQARLLAFPKHQVVLLAKTMTNRRAVRRKRRVSTNETSEFHAIFIVVLGPLLCRRQICQHRRSIHHRWSSIRSTSGPSTVLEKLCRNSVRNPQQCTRGGEARYRKNPLNRSKELRHNMGDR